MDLSRRTVLKMAAATAVVPVVGAGLRPAAAEAVAAGTPTRDALPSGLAWPSGYRPKAGDSASDLLSELRGFESWRGHRADLSMVFAGRDTWASWDSIANAYPVNTLGRALVQAGYQVVFAIPLVRAGDKGNFARGAGTAGSAALADHRAGHAKIADRVRQITNGVPCYVRLGWEANKGYPWSYTKNGSSHDPADPATYRACWANTAAVWRDHCPAAALVWNHLKFPDGSANRITAYYPGDDAVDILGIDPYDNGSYGYATDKARFDKAILGINGTFPGWDPQTGRCQGLNGMLLFARSRGKKLSVCEWAPINNTKKYADPADNPYYVKAMHDFFAAHTADIAYESLFSGDGHELYPRVSYNSRSSDAYRTAYRG